MMNRDIKTKLPSIRKPLTTAHHIQAQQKDAAAKTKQKEYADRHRRAKEREYKVGDKVLIHQKKTTTKLPYDPDPFTVTQITATRRGQQMTRIVDKWKFLKDRPLHLRTLRQGHTVTRAEDSDSDDDFDPPARAPAAPHQQGHQDQSQYQAAAISP